MTQPRHHRGVAATYALVALVALVALAALAGCRGQPPEEVTTTTAVTVQTVPAQRGTIRGVVHASGVVTPAPDAELVVVAPEAARIAEIPHGTGDRVRRGDMLVRFDIPGAAAEVQRQQAERARADAAVANARAAQTRARDLFDRGVAARKEVEDADRAMADAEAAVAQARASLAAAQSVSGRAVVRATFDGVIVKRSHNPGDLVEASAGDPVLRVVDLDRLEVVAAIPLSDASRVQVGAPAALVNAPAGTADVELKVLTRPTAVETGTASVPVRLGFARRVSLPVGSPVQLEIGAEQHNNAIVVPTSALVREGDETAAFVASEGKAHRRTVQVGLTDGIQVEIVSGLDAGDRVIVEGQAGLPDDAAVTEAPAGKDAASPPPAEKDAAK